MAHNEDSDWSLVMIVLPSWQTMSEYLPFLKFKSPIRRIEPREENFPISFSSSSNRSGHVACTWHSQFCSVFQSFQSCTINIYWRKHIAICERSDVVLTKVPLLSVRKFIMTFRCDIRKRLGVITGQLCVFLCTFVNFLWFRLFEKQDVFVAQ